MHKTVPAQQFFPQQKGLDFPQIPHRNKLYFSLLSCSDFGILSCLTAAVSEKTRRVPAYLETIPRNLEVELMKTSRILILVQVLCMLAGLLATAAQASLSERTTVINHVRAL